MSPTDLEVEHPELVRRVLWRVQLAGVVWQRVVGAVEACHGGIGITATAAAKEVLQASGRSPAQQACAAAVQPGTQAPTKRRSERRASGSPRWSSGQAKRGQVSALRAGGPRSAPIPPKTSPTTVRPRDTLRAPAGELEPHDKHRPTFPASPPRDPAAGSMGGRASPFGVFVAGVREKGGGRSRTTSHGRKLILAHVK